MEIHELHEKDIPVLCSLYGQLTGEPADEKAVRRVLDETDGDPHYILFCVYGDDDRLIATATLTKCLDLTDDARYYYNMENFVVDETCRCQGVGTFLMKAVEQYASEHGGRYINFTSSSERKEAHMFYRSLGYDSGYVKGFKKRL